MFDVQKIRSDFPMLNTINPLIFFDNSSTTLKPFSVIQAVSDYYTNESVNAFRGDYAIAAQVSTKYESVRAKVAQFINASKEECIFTSGASAALNLVAYGYGRKFLEKDDVVLTSEVEHASSILPWMEAVRLKQAKIEYIALDEYGRITLENVKKAMNENVKVIVIAQVSNVLGYINDIQAICAYAHEHGVIVVVDGAQSVAHMPIDVKQLDCDFFAFSAHKMLGPTGIGILYGKKALLEQCDTLEYGGGSNARFDLCGNIKLKEIPYRFETGTPAIEAAYGLGAAITYLETLGMNEIEQYESELRQYFITQLSQLDNVVIYNKEAETGIITFNIKDVFAQDAASYFSEHNIAVRSGQHCAKLLMKFLKAPATLRASIYFYNTKAEIDKFVEICRAINLESTLDIFF